MNACSASVPNKNHFNWKRASGKFKSQTHGPFYTSKGIKRRTSGDGDLSFSQLVVFSFSAWAFSKRHYGLRGEVAAVGDIMDKS